MNEKSSYTTHGETFVIRQYNQAKTFSNFFASIAGEMGIPLWVFYVNRAQAVCAFGLKDKDHAFLEFQPANKAYQSVHSAGFRTFIKINGKGYYEPFREDARYRGSSCVQNMYINSQDLTLVEENKPHGLIIRVEYFLIVEEPFPGLVRKVTIQNTGKKPMRLEVLDGLSQVVAYPENNWFLKEMSCTIQAWALAEELKNKQGYLFRLKVDPADVADTKFIEGGNLYTSVRYTKGTAEFLPVIVDPDAVFGAEKALLYPMRFARKAFAFPRQQIQEGKTLCAFTHLAQTVPPKESCSFYSLASSLEDRGLVERVLRKIARPEFFAQKYAQGRKIVQQVKDKLFCVSGNEQFDAYVAQNFLDNVLRGGLPAKMQYDEKTYPYYIYSRKHGDLERDYNRFVLTPSFFSEGEANFRDINQNRRMDPWIFPYVQDENILSFFNVQRIDGYNPLLFKGVRYALKDGSAAADLNPWIERASDEQMSALLEFLKEPFYLGAVSIFLRKQGMRLMQDRWHDFAGFLIDRSRRIDEADFGEGFWIDHFTYNIDLLESYAAIYPDKIRDVVFNKREFVFWDDAHVVKPRQRRFVIENDTVFQLHALEVLSHKKEIIQKRKKDRYVLHTQSGRVYKTTLCVKLLTVILNKLATLDPFGVGIEMEADKPGWCDSLNGLPALCGSSLPETAELKRWVVMLKQYLVQFPEAAQSVSVPEELCVFFYQLDALLKNNAAGSGGAADFEYWDTSNRSKEQFREAVANGVSDTEKEIAHDVLCGFLDRALSKIESAFLKARRGASYVYPTYFMNVITSYDVTQDGFAVPTAFVQKPLPEYLEGQVRMLKVTEDPETARKMVQAVRKSILYDKPLGMYRLNASLKKESLYIGRSRVFPPGWLENESIWLHMEYKYLLEMLKAGLYKEFDEAFHRCAVCFHDPDVYGRSIFENSSFIVSSAHADKDLWGRGFVARLSGSTAEMVNMFLLMAVGNQPFCLQHGQLSLRFRPFLKKEWFTDRVRIKKIYRHPAVSEEIIFPAHTFSFMFLGETVVVYHNPSARDIHPQKHQPERIVLDGDITLDAAVVPPPYAEQVRQNYFKRIDIYFD